MRAVTVTLGDGQWGLGTVQGGPFESDQVYPIGSPYGPRPSIDTPEGPTGDFHNGLDIAAPEGVPLVALFAGVIIGAYSSESAGNFIRYAPQGLTPDDDGYCQVEYFHMRDAPALAEGALVAEGDELGIVGATGKATGPHLHLGVVNRWGYIDPFNFLLSGGITAPPPPPMHAQPVETVTPGIERDALVAALQGGAMYVDLGPLPAVAGVNHDVRVLLP